MAETTSIVNVTLNQNPDASVYSANGQSLLVQVPDMYLLELLILQLILQIL